MLAFIAAPMVFNTAIRCSYIYKYSYACKGKYTGSLLTKDFMYIANRLSRFTETICSRAVNPYPVRDKQNDLFENLMKQNNNMKF